MLIFFSLVFLGHKHLRKYLPGVVAPLWKLLWFIAKCPAAFGMDAIPVLSIEQRLCKRDSPALQANNCQCTLRWSNWGDEANTFSITNFCPVLFFLALPGLAVILLRCKRIFLHEAQIFHSKVSQIHF